MLGFSVFACFSWTLLGFFNKLSSFLLYLTAAEIAEIFAFMMAFALLESLALTGCLVLLSMFLPSSWLQEGFSIKGLVIILICAAASIVLQKNMPEGFPSPLWLTLAPGIPLGVIVLLFRLIHLQPRVRDTLLNIQDRISILMYVYIPLGALSLIVTLYRNLL